MCDILTIRTKNLEVERRKTMKKRKISFFYRLFLIASLLGGIVLSLKNTAFVKYLLSYYTIQSNIVCLITFFLFLIGDIIKYDYRNKKWYPILKGAITMAILVTFIIYISTLLPNKFLMYQVSINSKMIGKKIGNCLVHGISPILVIGDYFFDEKGKCKNYYPICWLFFPTLYVYFIYSKKRHFYGIGGSRKYGYFFLDPEKVGTMGVILWITGIIIGILVIGYVFVFFDQKLANRKKKK